MIIPIDSVCERGATVNVIESVLFVLFQQIRQAFIIPATVTEILK